MLRRHLTTRHGLSAEDYLKRWGLAGDHPLTAPAYSAQRSTLAAVGHRVVHGGQFTSSVRVTPEIRQRITARTKAGSRRFAWAACSIIPE